MTRISLIHAIPPDEYIDRGKAVANMPAVPYLSLTQGEMDLDLLKQRLTLLSQFYPEVSAYKKGAHMLDVALKNGLHRGANFIGAIDDQLQPLARVIARNVARTRPAAGKFYGRANAIVGIGEVIPLLERVKACKAAAKTADEYFGCETKFNIERIFNDRIEGVGHHVVYKGLNEQYPDIPSRAFTKLVLHNAGIGAMAQTAEVADSLMSSWVENAIMFKNAASGASPIGSATTSFYLSDDPEAALAKYTDWLKKRTGSVIRGTPVPSAIGEFTLVTVAIIIAVIRGAIKIASDFMTAIQKHKFMAMSTAQGFGTDAYKAQQSDWLLDPNNPSNGQQDNMMLYLALAGGAYLLMSND